MKKKPLLYSFSLQALALLAISLLSVAPPLHAGPYNEVGIQSYDTGILGWATGYQNLIRGPYATYGSPQNILGEASCSYTDVLSLGDGGKITLTFDVPIGNGTGPDFAVFENSFYSGGALFAELAFVEVSSDGVNFARFPCVSLTPNSVDSYGTLDPTNVHNLAGKHPGANVTPCEGTPFDLSDLANNPLVQSGQVRLDQIQYVRIVDVVGSGSTECQNAPPPVYDPYPTNFSQGGFDLQAVAVLNTENTGCFIATAAYGSSLSGKIRLLRSFRERILVKSALGQAMVKYYYGHAQPWADWIGRHEAVRSLVRVLLAPVIGLAWILLGLFG